MMWRNHTALFVIKHQSHGSSSGRLHICTNILTGNTGVPVILDHITSPTDLMVALEAKSVVAQQRSAANCTAIHHTLAPGSDVITHGWIHKRDQGAAGWPYRRPVTPELSRKGLPRTTTKKQPHYVHINYATWNCIFSQALLVYEHFVPPLPSSREGDNGGKWARCTALLPLERALMTLKAPEGAGFTFLAVFLETIKTKTSHTTSANSSQHARRWGWNAPAGSYAGIVNRWSHKMVPPWCHLV